MSNTINHKSNTIFIYNTHSIRWITFNWNIHIAAPKGMDVLGFSVRKGVLRKIIITVVTYVSKTPSKKSWLGLKAILGLDNFPFPPLCCWIESIECPLPRRIKPARTLKMKLCTWYVGVLEQTFRFNYTIMINFLCCLYFYWPMSFWDINETAS